MKVVVLYRSKSEHGTPVEEYVREFKRRTSRELKMIDVDGKEGWNLAELYGVTQYPAILATTEDGKLQNMWQGEPLPLMNEVMGYALEQ
jgi:hypothetical protein